MNLLAEKKEILLKTQLETMVTCISLDNKNLQLASVTNKNINHLAQDLQKKLFQYTQQKWYIQLVQQSSSNATTMTLAEQKKQEQQRQKQNLLQHPLILATENLFGTLEVIEIIEKAQKYDMAVHDTILTEDIEEE